MSVKKLVIQLEKHINIKFPEYNAKFYSNRINFYIHMGLDIWYLVIQILKNF